MAYIWLLLLISVNLIFLSTIVNATLEIIAFNMHRKILRNQQVKRF